MDIYDNTDQGPELDRYGPGFIALPFWIISFLFLIPIIVLKSFSDGIYSVTAFFVLVWWMMWKAWITGSVNKRKYDSLMIIAAIAMTMLVCSY